MYVQTKIQDDNFLTTVFEFVKLTLISVSKIQSFVIKNYCFL